MSFSPSNISLASNESDVRDANMASEEALSFYQQQTTVTGRCIWPKHRKRSDAPYLFEKTTKMTEMKIEMTASIPAIMARTQSAGPIHRPAPPSADNNGSFRRLQVIRCYFPNEQHDDTMTHQVRRYATPTPAQAGPSHLRRVPEVIVVSDEESNHNPKESTPDIFTQRPVVQQDGHNEDDDIEIVEAVAPNIIDAINAIDNSVPSAL